MPVDCDTTCGDYALIDWMRLSQKERNFLLYCALNSAASQGNPELIGVYEVTADENYDAPADASLIIWNVPAQSGDRVITFNGNPGQETQVLVIDSNGFNVGDSFTGGSVFLLNDVAPYVVNVRMVDSGTGEIVRSDGTAAQYDVGTSGITIPLLSTANTFGANQIIQGSTGVDSQTVLTVRRSDVPTRNIQLSPSQNGGNWMLMGSADTGHESGIRSEASSAVVTVGINSSQFGTRDNASTGGIFRLDTRAAGGLLAGQQAFIIIGIPTGGAVNTTRLAVSLQDGNTLLIPNGGTVTIGPAASSTAHSSQLYGAATMAAGTTGSIADTTITAGSFVQVTPEFAPAGRLYYTISAGVGFTILSTDAGDAGRVSYQRIRP